jgi:hypothetical protein
MSTIAHAGILPATTGKQPFLLERTQPALSGLMDGPLSTLAPIFAVMRATHHPLTALRPLFHHPARPHRHAADPGRLRRLGHRRRRLGLRLGQPGRHRLRAASYQGLRDDKDPAEVIREL